MPASRPPLERMLQIHRLLKAGGYPNCTKIAREMEVSTKTIGRDIDFMRDRLHLPIEYHPTRYGYYYAAPVEQFPTVQITEGEMMALLVAQKALAQYEGTPYAGPLRAAFDKLTQSLQEPVAFHAEGIESVVSFKNAGASPADLDFFEQLSRAAMDGKEVRITYRKPGAGRDEGRTVCPYHLACVDGQWYLIAFDMEREQVRTFALPRVRSAALTGKTFRRPAGFSAREYLGGSFGVFKSTGNHRVVVRLDAFAGPLVSERRWHESQEVTPLADGGAEVRFQLGGLEEIERWVLGWGDHAVVLEPAELREKISGVASRLANLYQKTR